MAEENTKLQAKLDKEAADLKRKVQVRDYYLQNNLFCHRLLPAPLNYLNLSSFEHNKVFDIFSIKNLICSMAGRGIFLFLHLQNDL